MKTRILLAFLALCFASASPGKSLVSEGSHYRRAVFTMDGKVTSTSSSCRVTLSVGGKSKSFYFSGTPGAWVHSRSSMLIEIPIGDTLSATVVSTWGISDYRIRAKQYHVGDGQERFKVELGDTQSIGISKSQIAGGAFDVRTRVGHFRYGPRAGELNYFEALELGKSEEYGVPPWHFRLHLGVATSGESNGSIRARLYDYNNSLLGIILEEGRGILDVLSLANSKRQILTDSNLIVIEKISSSDARISFYPEANVTLSGGQYTTADPYTVSYLFKRTATSTEKSKVIRTMGSESFELDYDTSTTTEFIPEDEYNWVEIDTNTVTVYPWYRSGTTRSRRVESITKVTYRTIGDECWGETLASSSNSRLMTYYQGSTIVYQERGSYGGGLSRGMDDPAQQNSSNFYKERIFDWDTPDADSIWTHGKGNVRTIPYRSDLSVNNLGSNPFAAVGSPKEVQRTFKDADNQLATSYQYEASSDQLTARLKSAVTKLGTQTVASDTRSYSENTFSHRSGQSLPAVTETRTVATSPGQPSLVSTRRHYRETVSDPYFANKPISVVNPDGSKTSYGYERGTWNGSAWTYSATGTDLRVVSVTGKTGSGVSNFENMYLDPLDLDHLVHGSYYISRAPATETIYSKFGQVVSQALWVYTGPSSKFVRISRTFNEYDGEGNLTKTRDPDSGIVSYQASYSNGRKAWETDISGHKTSYEYDSATGFLKKSTREAVGAAVPAVVTDYVVDSLGRVVKETVGGQLVTERAYDQAGRVAWEKAPGGYQTSYTYDYNETGTSSRTVTYPDGSTKVEVRHRDGRLKSVSGTAVPDMTYAYAYSGGKLETTETASTGEWSRTTTDQAGRLIQTEAPKHGGGTSKTVRVFNSSGQLVREEYLTGSTRIQPSTLYQYDAYHNLRYTASDTNNNNVLDHGSDANALEFYSHYQKMFSPPSDEYHLGDWLLYEVQQHFIDEDSGNATLVGQRYTQLSGFNNSTGFAGYEYTRDIQGNYAFTETTVDKANKKITLATNAPGSTTDLQTVLAAGKVISERNDQGHTTTHEYDAQGRLIATIDPRGIDTDITYYKSSGAATSGTTRPATIVEDDGQQTSFGYYSHGGQEYVQDHLGKRSYSRYDPSTRTSYTWGNSARPTKTVHDDLGRIKELHTYRGSISSWTSMSGNGDKTAWTYHGSTGLPYQKIDAQGRTATYASYDAAGRLTHSIDPRGVDTYHYYYDVAYASSNKFSGLLREAYYNVSGTTAAATPRERYEYQKRHLSTSRMSREISPGSGTYYHWDYDYDDLDSGEGVSLNLLSETLPSGYYGSGRTFSYAYEPSGSYNPSSSNAFGRPTSFSFIGDSTYRNAYAYSSNGQLNTITPTHQSSTVFDYDYLANSNLVSKLQRGSYKRQTTYAANSYLQTDMVTDWGGANVTHVKIGHDALKRVNLHRINGSIGIWSSGSASGLYEDFSYNDRSELNVTTARPLNSNWTGGGAFDSRDYDFDSMGNLTNRKEGSQNQAHVANNLNQYTTAWNDGSSRSLSYDLAGNMTSDGVYTYTYDAKNQLVGMSGAGKTATYTYDPQGRRISKAVTGYSEVRFAYDGWNLVAELNSSGAVLKKYTWGLDASGSFHPPSSNYGVTGGAGGVGGLLMIEQGGSQYYPVYDGRQNVIGLHNSSGTLVAWYEYDPFGRLLGSGGSAVAVNPFRFSTKYTDHEMDKDLVYYGLRYYHAEMGRFVNRDPIEEAGGLNLYGFVGNSPTNYYDYLGMEPKPERRYADTDGDGLYDRVDQQVGTEWKQLDGLDAAARGHNHAVQGSDQFHMDELGYSSLDEYMGDIYGAEDGASLGDAYASSQSEQALGHGQREQGVPADPQNLGQGGFRDEFGHHMSFCMSCHDTTDPGAQLKMAMAMNTTKWERFGRDVTILVGTAAIPGPKTPALPNGYGIAIVRNGVVLEADLTVSTSHAALARSANVLVRNPQAGVAGQLVRGTEAVTFRVKDGALTVTRSMNFPGQVSDDAVQGVTKYLQNLAKANQ